MSSGRDARGTSNSPRVSSGIPEIEKALKDAKLDLPPLPISQQEPRCRAPREGLGYLTCEPDLGRVPGDIEVNDPSAVEDDHGVEQLKSRSRNNEHVDAASKVRLLARARTALVARSTAFLGLLTSFYDLKLLGTSFFNNRERAANNGEMALSGRSATVTDF